MSAGVAWHASRFAPPATVPARALSVVMVVGTGVLSLWILLRGTAPRGADLVLLAAAGLVAYCLPAAAALGNSVMIVAGYGAAVLAVDGAAGVVPVLLLATAATVLVRAVSALRARLVDALAVALRDARTDDLTGLANRRAFYELSNHEIVRCQRSGLPLAVLVAGIDAFGELHEAGAGHHPGDTVLRLVGALLSTQKRGSDVLASLGGGQFAVLLPACANDDALRRAEHIRSLVERTSRTWPNPVTVSIGAAAVSDRLRTVVEVLTEAEAALSEISGKGGNAVTMAPPPWQQPLPEPHGQRSLN
ncbi:MAG: GGDEF domain-containing protein [Dactylosporangium sp.]|nr:GGDEF domain-containing protein [Dactylosporangium sp.]NNJ61958.1 GGDEF domain-containing protein [Dactylosporangium sp.]